MAPLLGKALFLVRGAASLLESEPPQALMASRAVAVRARAEMRGEVFMAVFIALLKPRFNSGGLCLTEIHFSTSRLFGGFFFFVVFFATVVVVDLGLVVSFGATVLFDAAGLANALVVVVAVNTDVGVAF